MVPLVEWSLTEALRSNSLPAIDQSSLELPQLIDVRTVTCRLEHINVKIHFLLGSSHSNPLTYILTQHATKNPIFLQLGSLIFKSTSKSLVL